MHKPWLSHYPAGVPAQIDPSRYRSLVALMDESFARHGERPALRYLGRTLRYADVESEGRRLAAWLQGAGLVRGDRVAVMLPNVPQYAAAVAAILRAGCVVVNVNPLYTVRELRHQLSDSGAAAIVVLENFAHVLQQCVADTAVRHVVVCAMGDALGPVRGALVNAVVRRVKKLVPAWSLPGAVRWRAALARGARIPFAAPEIGPDDVALLQYTGGTTGVSKGAVLLHRNVVANVLQSEAWHAPALARVPAGEQLCTVCALPLYHIYAFTCILMLGLRAGGRMVLVPNPRDLGATLAALAQERIHVFPAVNTLFAALLDHRAFDRVDWRHLVASVGGGSAVQAAVAERWRERTGCPVSEGYGLSEASPSVACNPLDGRGEACGIGLPLPSTEVVLLDDAGQPVAAGEAGEIAVRGPQVMAGYWQREDETAAALTPEGFLRTGDVGTVDARGFFTVVDRKKDMILVSGFNVYPNEVEDVVAALAGVAECVAVGMPDARTGEAVRLVVVPRRAAGAAAPSADDIAAHCRANLTNYKRPRVIEFREALPKTPIGKILRRAVRDEPVLQKE